MKLPNKARVLGSTICTSGKGSTNNSAITDANGTHGADHWLSIRQTKYSMGKIINAEKSLDLL